MHWEHIGASRSRDHGARSDRLHSDRVEAMKQTCTTSAHDRHRHLRGSLAERTYHYSGNLSLNWHWLALEAVRLWTIGAEAGRRDRAFSAVVLVEGP